MKMKSVRQAILLAAVLAGTAALAVGPALAAPVCGGVASLMNHQLYKWQDVTHKIGDNIVSIPAISPINNNPTSPTANGFIDLCKRFGLTGTTTVLRQFKADTPGSVATYNCNQAIAPPFTPGQAVLIEPTADVTGKIPGVECAQPYTFFIEVLNKVDGDNYYPTPLTLAGGGGPLTGVSGGARDLCNMMGYPAETNITQIFAQTGTVDSFLCGPAHPGAAAFTLQLGNGVLVQPPSTVTATPVLF
jgi:hypothetical protein